MSDRVGQGVRVHVHMWLVAGFQTRSWIRGTLDKLVSPDRHNFATDTAERADLPLSPRSLRNRARIEAEKKKEEIEAAKMTVQVMEEAQQTLAKIKVGGDRFTPLADFRLTVR